MTDKERLDEVIRYFDGYGSPHDEVIINMASEVQRLKEENEELKSAMKKVCNNVGAFPKATVRTYVKSVFDPLLGMEESK